ncbi:MAG TPA: SRPBCC family protein [Anaerolineales bacterium]|nr:SRPBCC family protein [Anaerolineales bacterium]
MHSFELTTLINCPRDQVYDHLSNPLNLIGLQPLLTELIVHDAQSDEQGIVQRSFESVETFRLAGLPVFHNRIHSILRLTHPKEVLEFKVFSKPGIEILFTFTFQSLTPHKTQISETVQFVRLNKFLERFVISQARHAQEALLTNLKVRLENRRSLLVTPD